MLRPWRKLSFAAFVLAGSLSGPGASAARAQYLMESGRTVIVAPAAPMVGGGTTFVQPTRRIHRRRGRYKAMRPTYTPGERFTFAPYSDRYYPRTTPPQGSVYSGNP
jgi:hypothetical protein